MSRYEEKAAKVLKMINEIRPVKQSQEAGLLKRKGVTGVDIGYKYVKGKKTDELAIRVYVKEKRDVSKDEMIPKTIGGVKTDVIQRRFVLHPLKVQLKDIKVMADTGSYDPLKGGISIGPCRVIGGYIYAGTLGAIVKDNSTHDKMLLSNFHVMCVDNAWHVGDTMCQPSRVDGGHCPADVVGQLQRAALGGQVDCAVASHTARGSSCSIVDIGWVTGKATAGVGIAVRKRGRTSGLTYGTVDTVDLTVTVDYGDGIGDVTLTDQIGIDVDTTKSTVFGISGDSGSVVVDDNNKVVGLYFAGNEEDPDADPPVPAGIYGVANPIQAVLDELDVSLCLGPIKKFEPEKWFFEPPWEMIEKFKHFEPIDKLKGELLKPEMEKYKGEIPGLPKETGPLQPTPGGTTEERLANLEGSVAILTHFIRTMLRPDLSESALKYESGIEPKGGPGPVPHKLRSQ